MIEVEIKLPIADKEKTEQSLRQYGFELRKSVRESDLYFNYNNLEEKDFNKSDEALRIRNIKNLISGEEESVLTYKGPKIDKISMTRQELETGIADAGILEELLFALGFTQRFPVIKERHYYCMASMTACVDQVEGLGDYLELEVLVPAEKDRAEALNKIEKVLKQLGHEMRETTRISYLSMLQKKEE